MRRRRSGRCGIERTTAGRGARRALRRLAWGALVFLLLAGPRPAAALDPGSPHGASDAAVPPSSLPGIWRIDWAKSDPRPRVDGSWIPSGTLPGRGSRDEGSDTAPRRGRRRFLDAEPGAPYAQPLAAQTIIIFQHGAHLEISEDGRAAQPVDLGAIAVNASASPLSSIREGRWENPNLILTRSIPGGGIMTQTFTLATDGNVLELSARIQRQPDEAPLLIHRVYNK
ncbi:MAG: hypothetical protein ACM3JJ_03760, partial [Hyphomicrobiales bacterium]